MSPIVRYFSNAPTVDIPGRLFPVREWLLEEIVEKLDYQPKTSGRERDKGNRQRFKSLMESHGGHIDGRDKARDQIAEEQRLKAQFWDEKFWSSNSLGGQIGGQNKYLRLIDAS